MPIRRGFILNYIHVQSRLLDGRHELVHELHPSTNYLHAVEIIGNLSLWPVDVVVRSTLQTHQQLAYLRTGAPEKWEFPATLLPNHGFQEQAALLDCVAKTSGKEEVTTTLMTDSGYQDRLSIEVQIK